MFARRFLSSKVKQLVPITFEFDHAMKIKGIRLPDKFKDMNLTELMRDKQKYQLTICEDHLFRELRKKFDIFLL